jgi:hypothetical protein
MAEMKICGRTCRINILSQFDLLQLRILQFLGRLGSFFDLRGFWFGLCGFCAGGLGFVRLSVVGPPVGLWVILGRGGVGVGSARPSK